MDISKNQWRSTGGKAAKKCKWKFKIQPIDFFQSYPALCFSGSDTWPTLYKAGEKQVANMLWLEEGLYADLPFGYVDNLTEFYSSDSIQHVQQVKFPPRQGLESIDIL